MKILEAREVGHGILVENDGYITPNDNKGMLKEMSNNDFGGEIYMNMTPLIEMVGFTQKRF